MTSGAHIFRLSAKAGDSLPPGQSHIHTHEPDFILSNASASVSIEDASNSATGTGIVLV